MVFLCDMDKSVWMIPAWWEEERMGTWRWRTKDFWFNGAFMLSMSGKQSSRIFNICISDLCPLSLS